MLLTAPTPFLTESLISAPLYVINLLHRPTPSIIHSAFIFTSPLYPHALRLYIFPFHDLEWRIVVYVVVVGEVLARQIQGHQEEQGWCSRRSSHYHQEQLLHHHHPQDPHLQEVFEALDKEILEEATAP